MSPPRHQNTGGSDEFLPSVPCTFSEDDRRDIRDIKQAVIGDSKFGHRGLVNRMTAVERAIVVIGAALILIGGDRVIHIILK